MKGAYADRCWPPIITYLAFRSATGGIPHPPYHVYHFVVIGLAVLVLCACARSDLFDSPVDEPIVAGIDSPDEELGGYLESMIRSARALPKSGLVRGRLGMAYDVNGFKDAAIASYEQAESLDPNDFRWPYFGALLLAQNGQHEAALGKLEHAFAIDSDYPAPWLWRGTWLLELGRPEEAETAFERARGLGAVDAATFGRARVLIMQQQHAEAAALLEPLADETGHPYIYRSLGKSLMALGRTQEARSAIALSRNAQQFAWDDKYQLEKASHYRGLASFHLAVQLSLAGRGDEALTIMERLRRYHTDAQCGQEENFFFACSLLNSLSLAYARADRGEQALAVVQRGLAINPDFASFHITIADYYYQLRDLQNAISHSDSAMDLNPMLAKTHEQRGQFLLSLGSPSEAKVALEMALSLEPAKPTTLFYLGMAEAQLNNWRGSVERFERAIQLDPGFALGHAYLARSLGEQGRITEAWQAYANAEQFGADAAELRKTEQRLRELEPSS